MPLKNSLSNWTNIWKGLLFLCLLMCLWICVHISVHMGLINFKSLWQYFCNAFVTLFLTSHLSSNKVRHHHIYRLLEYDSLKIKINAVYTVSSTYRLTEEQNQRADYWNRFANKIWSHRCIIGCSTQIKSNLGQEVVDHNIHMYTTICTN